MEINNINKLCYLDKLRVQYGTEKFKEEFYKLGNNNKIMASALLNSKRLYFGSLYILMPEIKKLNLMKYLDSRNIIGINMCGEVLKEDITYEIKSVNSEMTKRALKWMAETGYYDDGLDDNFDEIIDAAISTLIVTYNDKNILPTTAKLIFNRNKKGFFIHDLVWAFFQSKTPYTLKLTANYLRSSHPKDVQLACKLLDIDESITINSNSDKYKKYKEYISWLNNNNSFLYYTGENFQLSSNPQPFNVDLSSKYLCKKVSDHNISNVSLNKNNISRIESFNRLKYDEKIILSDFSYSIFKSDIRLWNKWIKYSVDKQLKIAKKELGGNNYDSN